MASQSWDITGNSGTSVTGNFLGTTDSVALAFRVNNQSAGYISPTLWDNFSLGYKANLSNAGILNLALGTRTLANLTTGNSNLAIGTLALEMNTSGSSNLAIGYSNLGKNTTGNDNIAIGTNTLNTSTTASGNIALGKATLQNTNANYNTAIGHGALTQNTTGANNIAIGYNAGNNIATGSNNIFIGTQTTLSGASGSNQMNIGNLIFGNNMTGDINNPAGNIGIRIVNPQQPLHVEGAARITGSAGTPVKLMGRDANGDIGDIETGDGLQLSGGILSASMDETTGSETKKIQYYGAYQQEKTVINGFFEFRTVHAGTNAMGYQIRMTVNPGGNVTLYCAYGAAWGGVGTTTLQARNTSLTFTTGNWNNWQQISSVEQSLNGHNVMVSVDTQSATNLGSSPIFYNLIVQRIGDNGGTGLKTLVINRY